MQAVMEDFDKPIFNDLPRPSEKEKADADGKGNVREQEGSSVSEGQDESQVNADTEPKETT